MQYAYRFSFSASQFWQACSIMKALCSITLHKGPISRLAFNQFSIHNRFKCPIHQLLQQGILLHCKGNAFKRCPSLISPQFCKESKYLTSLILLLSFNMWLRPLFARPPRLIDYRWHLWWFMTPNLSLPAARYEWNPSFNWTVPQLSRPNTQYVCSVPFLPHHTKAPLFDKVIHIS